MQGERGATGDEMLDLAPSSEIYVLNTNPFPVVAGSYAIAPGGRVRVPLSFLASYGNLPGLVPDFSEYAEHMSSTDESGRPSFDYYCPLSAVDGYGRHALDIYRGLLEIGAAPVLRSSGFEDRDFLDPGILTASLDNKRRPPRKVSLTFSVPWDKMHTDNPSVFRVSICQFETDHVPARHVEVLSKVDHLIVTSKFQPKVWKASGYKGRISVMTPGVDTSIFKPVIREAPGYFRCLILGALSGRKNSAAAVRIFQRASGGDPRWRLTVKTRGFLDAFVADAATHDGRIRILNVDAPPGSISRLYAEHDALIWPSKGEGVGLPPLEAMATGMEVVLSDNTGMSDYIDKRHCWPIKMRGTEPADRDGTFSPQYIATYGGVGNFQIADEDHGVDQLRNAYNAWLEGKGKGPKAAEYVLRHHTLAHQAESVLSVVQEYL